jgi:signal peptidase
MEDRPIAGRRRLALVPAGVVAVAAIAVLLIAAAPILSPLHTQIVLSGSMSPAIPLGALVFTAPIEGLAAPGDVILFPHPLGPTTVVHRVVAVEVGAAASDYVTKGDANTVEDGWRISTADASGRVVAVVPYAGYVIGTLRQPLARLGVGLLVLAFVWPPLIGSVRRARPLSPAVR